MNVYKKILALALAAVMVLSLCACSAGFTDSTTATAAPAAADSAAAPAATEAPASNKTLVAYESAEIATLQQWAVSESQAFDAINQAFEGLYRNDANNEAQPALATDCQISEDGLTYTFTIRSGAVWSNGTPVTANDFVFSWLKQMSADATNGYSFIMTDYIVNGAEYNAGTCDASEVGVAAADDSTFVVTLKNPCSYFLRLTTLPMFFPLNQEFVEGLGDQYATSADTMIYCGPYVITSYDAAAGVTFVKNPTYWDAANVAIENAEIKIIKESATALNAFLAGNLSMVKLDASNVEQYKDDPRFSSSANFRTEYLQFNLEDAVMSNVNIRKAVSYSIDVDLLASAILKDGSVGAKGMIAAGMYGDGSKTFRELNGEVNYCDPEAAKAAWEQGCAELGYTPDKLTLLVRDDSVTASVATFVQDQIYSTLGVECVIDTKTTKERGTLMDENNYQFAITAWGADYDDAMTYLDLYLAAGDTGKSTHYRGNYASAEYNDLITKAKVETDAAVRLDEMLKAEKLLVAQDCVVSGLYHRGAAYLIDDSVNNFVMHPFGVDYEFKYASFN